ncbi:bifunctional xylanase deacetylase [Fusarium acutatum]|uniref:Bifunctional xylanase deacetylase n=1 Tax=Fusarium acutatum TaxID=78861 RepID=A0A8H4JV38_9HYPO|nr:bifunctional xylanase deacetylase [Fusarium acutatum]
MEKRQSSDGRCGTGFGTICASDECCSSAGWCGNGYLYCSAPACQIDYGPACDANIRPTGPDTINVARPKVGSIPYGQAIYDCEVNGGIALTYDDGPYTYTEDLLNILDEYNAKATFFITGRNLGKEAINDPATPWPNLIKRMINSGHQIGSHTWSHQRLTELSKPKFWNQMIYNEIALSDMLGYFPTYMRPPYSASNTTTDAWLGELGYHITYFDLDTEGYLHDSPSLIDTSKEIWDNAVEGRDPKMTTWLDIEHDPVYQSVYNLTEYILKSLNRNGFKTVTVGECLGDPKENWYPPLRGHFLPPPTAAVGPTKEGQPAFMNPTARHVARSMAGAAQQWITVDEAVSPFLEPVMMSPILVCRALEPRPLSQIRPWRLSARTADAGQSMAARLVSRNQGQLAAHNPAGAVPQRITVARDVSQTLEPADLQRR